MTEWLTGTAGDSSLAKGNGSSIAGLQAIREVVPLEQLIDQVSTLFNVPYAVRRQERGAMRRFVSQRRKNDKE